jgi:hypothetical protein
MLPDRTPSRAGSLPHGFVVNRDVVNTEGPVGVSLLAKRPAYQQRCCLTERLREQARSHMDLW